MEPNNHSFIQKKLFFSFVLFLGKEDGDRHQNAVWSCSEAQLSHSGWFSGYDLESKNEPARFEADFREEMK